MILHDKNFKEALNYAISQKGYAFIHAFDDDDIIAGQGTIGIEILDEMKEVDVILVPVGGGGLISGIAVGRVGEKIFEIIKKNVDDIIKVSGESIAVAILLFLERKKLVAEGAGAAALAALIEQKERFKGKMIILVLSGGNIDFTLIDRIINKGLVSNSRVGVFNVIVDDVPGSLHKLTGIVVAHGANIINLVNDRLADVPIGKALAAS